MHISPVYDMKGREIRISFVPAWLTNMNFRTGPDGGVIYYGVQYEVAKALAGAHNAGLTFAPPEDGKWGSIVNKGE